MAILGNVISVGKGSGSDVSCVVKINTSPNATVTAYLGSNSITATANSTGLATLTLKKEGLWTITSTDGKSTNSVTLNVAFSYTVNQDCKLIGTLNETPWSLIKQVSELGQMSNYWGVGDCKAVTINGTVGTQKFNNETFYCFIIGADHNKSVEGSGIHFQFGKSALTGGVDLAFADSNYGYSNNSSYKMCSENTNTGGWSGSYMRNTICTAFLAALPEDLRSVISACTKYTDNTGGDSSKASNVTTTSDKIWLLAEFEVFGTRKSANSAEQNYQKQYSYYSSGKSTIKYQSNSRSSAAMWWLRSPVNNDASRFCLVKQDGTAYFAFNSTTYSFAPCFKV